MAVPAHAGTTSPGTVYVPAVGNNCGNSGKFYTGPNSSGSALALPNQGPPGVDGGAGDTFTVVNECAVTIYINAGSQSPGNWAALGAGQSATYTIPSNGLAIGAYDQNSVNFSTTYASTSLSGTPQPGGGGTNGGGTSSTSATAPVQETLSLAVSTANTSCTVGNPTGYSGSWLYLPKADECSQTGPSANPNAKLLGWATSSIFPRDVAQAQVDKKWGVIDDTFYGMRMIFIPAGMATFVSGSNNLFPIWDR